MNIKVYADGQLTFADKEFRCALGRGGVTTDKVEGDGATPTGVFPLLRLFWRGDKITSILSDLPSQTISADDGWCDDPAHPSYNKPVKLPFDARHEKMWRADDVYDLVIEIGHNNNPVVPGAGSAVFIHIAKPDYAPTEGCIALAKEDLLRLLPEWSTHTKIEIFETASTQA